MPYRLLTHICGQNNSELEATSCAMLLGRLRLFKDNPFLHIVGEGRCKTIGHLTGWKVFLYRQLSLQW